MPVDPRDATDLMAHIRALAGLGPRPAGSAAEAAAHDYAARCLREWGARVEVEPFPVWRSLAYPWLLVAGTLLVAAVLLWIHPPAALALAVPGAAGFASLAAGRPHLGRLFARHQSRNVVAIIPPRGEVRRRVVVLAHADTQRATFFWHPSQVRRFGASFRLNIALVAWLVAMALGAVLAPGLVPWRWLSLPSLAGLIWGAGVLLHRELFLPWVEGANDNASGVAVALELARRCLREPLRHTELWCVITGAEEVGAPAGAWRFFDRHARELAGATVLVPDNLGAGELRYLDGEGTFRFYRADGRLLRLAAELGERHPAWRLGPSRVATGSYTDALPALAHGFAAMAVWAERDGVLPNYHWPTDTLERVEPDTVRQALAFFTGLVTALDEGDGEVRQEG